MTFNARTFKITSAPKKVKNGSNMKSKNEGTNIIIIKVLLIMAIVSIVLALGIEVGFRFYYYSYFTKPSVPFFLESDVAGVPYLQVDFNKFRIVKDKPRIIAIGDYISIHKSWQNKTSYPEVLDLKLNHSFEIINTGAVFYSLPEEVNLLKNKALDYSPDVIIWGFVFNDFDSRKHKLSKAFELASHRNLQGKSHQTSLYNLTPKHLRGY